tara:strand:+ start:456 stop:821 length:366 start_codon:yes stop_codon:yes gene_type:complete
MVSVTEKKGVHNSKNKIECGAIRNGIYALVTDDRQHVARTCEGSNFKNDGFMITKEKMFIDYALSFYGKDGLYPHNCTDDLIVSVAKFYASKGKEFVGDSIDREKVRVMLNALGRTEINNK